MCQLLSSLTVFIGTNKLYLMEIIKRTRKVRNGELLRQLNHIGHRICWCRTQLGLTQAEAARQSGIPASSYHGRERGIRSIYLEEYWNLTDFLNRKWLEKYWTEPRVPCPQYEGTTIMQVKIAWILYGKMDG